MNHNTVFQGRIQSNVVGGVPELLGGCELDGAKRRRASATEAARSACRGSSAKRLPRELRQGSGGAKIGLLESWNVPESITNVKTGVV